MDIKAYIRELLFIHDCVIIPGFGGFIGNFSPARVDKITGTFTPPVKQISFNRNLNHNDGLLISKISFARGINYGDARYQVEEFVKGLTAQLTRGERVIFDNLGSFRNNRENSVQFEPETNINYFPGSFGLESFQYIPVKGYDVRRRVLRHIDREPISLSSPRRNLWRAAVVIPILALLIAVPLKTDLFKAKVEATSMNPLVTAELENNRKAVDEAVLTKPDSGVTVKPVTPVKAEIRQYSVITGSFKSEENALSHVESLRADGFNPEINQASNGFYRVTAAICGDIETALATRDTILKKFPGTWISKR